MPSNRRLALPGLVVRAAQCTTCIYRPGSRNDLDKLEEEVRGIGDSFDGFRACHSHEETVCCRGFWDQHSAACWATQVAQRINCVFTIDERRNVRHWPEAAREVMVDCGPGQRDGAPDPGETAEAIEQRTG